VVAVSSGHDFVSLIRVTRAFLLFRYACNCSRNQNKMTATSKLAEELHAFHLLALPLFLSTASLALFLPSPEAHSSHLNIETVCRFVDSLYSWWLERLKNIS
jgi:hypothetical protein